MEVKIPILTFKYASRSPILKCRVWNLSRIDQGQEFSLCLFVQDLLKNYGQSTEKEHWKQTNHTQNAIERF